MVWGARKTKGYIPSDKYGNGSEKGSVFIDLSPLLKEVEEDGVEEIVNLLRAHRSNFTNALIGEIYRMKRDGLFNIPTDERNFLVICIDFNYSSFPVSKLGYVLVQTEEDVVNHVHWVLSSISEFRGFDVRVVSKGGSRSTLNAQPAEVSPLRELPPFNAVSSNQSSVQHRFSR